MHCRQSVISAAPNSQNVFVFAHLMDWNSDMPQVCKEYIYDIDLFRNYKKERTFEGVNNIE